MERLREIYDFAKDFILTRPRYQVALASFGLGLLVAAIF